MTVFAEYARYYDLLYADKDYAGETEFVLGRLERAGCTPHTLLDLGCGTGRHALAMAERGIAVTGVDLSETMLEMGRRMLAHARPSRTGGIPPVLCLGDARSVRLNRRFDAVVSLFHVLSYQNTEEDAVAFFTTAREHLVPGGLFLCDFWYGPGVLTDPPVKRERRLEDSATHIVRTAEPEHHVNDNIVDVHYQISLTDKASGKTASFKERHTMRYWFLPELRRLAVQSGFREEQSGAWLTEDPPTSDDWYAWMLLVAQ